MPSAAYVGAGLVGGFLTARTTGVRALGGVVLAGCGGPLGSGFGTRVSRLVVATIAIGGIVAAGRRRFWSQPFWVKRRAGFAAGA